MAEQEPLASTARAAGPVESHVDLAGVPEASVSLRLTNVSKTYPGVVALRDVSFDVRAGEIHAIVGENGAGKSTLMGIAAGSIVADSGAIEIGGEVIEQPNPRETQRRGLAFVYQRPALLPDLSVAENLALAMHAERRPRLLAANEWAREQLAVLGLDIDPGRRVIELTVEERHLVEISKALALDPKVLVLDEPTEPLDADEIERLFVKIREIADRGTAVVYISHRLPEVRRISGRVTVLRDGEHRGTFATDEVTEDDILRLIVGRDVESSFPLKRGADEGDAPVLVISGLSGAPHFEDVSLTVRSGEIVGLGGIAGNGQREFIQALAGLRRSRGALQVGRTRVRLGSPGKARQAGIVYLPGDRHEEGLFQGLNVRENISVGSLSRFARAGVISRRLELEAVREQVDRLSIRTPSPQTQVSSLSGGNQQKAVLARALLANPKVLVAEEPTQGVDVGARLEIYRLLRDAARRGVAVIVLSTDAKELEGLCDRVLVFSRGRVIQEVAGDEVTEDLITHAAVMSTSLRSRVKTGKLGRVARFAIGDYLPSAILLAVIVGFAAYTTSVSDRFLSSFNITGLLSLLSVLVFVSLAQQVVMLTGGFDLSVGPLTGFAVVVGSFFINEGVGAATMALGFFLMFATVVSVGGVNGGLITGVRMSPVVATLVTFTILEGLSLLLRPRPAGFIDSTVIDTIRVTVGVVPAAAIAAAALAVALELALRWTAWGLQLRAVGSRGAAARALGIRIASVQLLAYMLAGLLVGFAAVALMAQIGVGDPLAGTTYTLSSIAAVVLGGASVFGGRGSFIGAFFGAALTQEVLNSTVFLEVSDAWQYWLVGGMIVIAAAMYAKTRSTLIGRSAGASAAE